MNDRRTSRGYPSASLWVAVLGVAIVASSVRGGELASQPLVARHGMVVSQETMATDVGLDVLRAGGSAVDATVATAFALAVTHPSAGNIGGGGFLLMRTASGETVAYDFRETAPAASTAEMFLERGVYSAARHHNSHLAVGVPGTVAGLHLAWTEHGVLPWRRLVEPAIRLARDGFVIPAHLASSLERVLPRMRRYPASMATFSKGGQPFEAGERLRQPALAATLERIAADGPDGFYRGHTAALIEAEMRANGGVMTTADLASYRPVKREPVTGTYRGYDITSMPPVSSGGTALVQMLNILEGYDLNASGFGSARTIHVMTEAMRRAFADRARYLGDPDFNPAMPVDRLLSKGYAREQRQTIVEDRASTSTATSFTWSPEGDETTHVSVVDAARTAVAMTYTLEQGYGSRIVVPDGGFLLNNEMGDFNAGPGLTNTEGLIGTAPNLAAPGKRMLSSMTPTIVSRDGRLVMVTGSPGGRTIINTVLQTIVNVLDFGMNIQEAVDAPRFHHQWLPDRIVHERFGFSPDTLAILAARGHSLVERARQGAAQAIAYDPEMDLLTGAADGRRVGSTARGH